MGPVDWKARVEGVARLDAEARGFRIARDKVSKYIIILGMVCLIAGWFLPFFSDNELLPWTLFFGTAMFWFLDQAFEAQALRKELRAEQAGRAYYSDKFAYIVSQAKQEVAEAERQEYQGPLQ